MRYAIVWACALLLLVATACSAMDPSPTVQSAQWAQAVEETPGRPTEAVTLLLPEKAGSTMGRLVYGVADLWTDHEGRDVPFPVLEITGRYGKSAMDRMRAQPDGNVLAFFSADLLLQEMAKGINPLRDLTPIAMVMESYGCFAVAKDSPIQSLEEVLQRLREDPLSVVIGGTSDFACVDHLRFLTIASAAGVQGLYRIPYKGYADGLAPVRLLSGDMDVLSCDLDTIRPLVESGEIVVLATTSPNPVRRPPYEDVPACMELGINASFLNWYGVFGPRDMPAEAVDYWRDAIGKTAQGAQWAALCEARGWKPAYLDLPDFTQRLEEEIWSLQCLLIDMHLYGD